MFAFQLSSTQPAAPLPIVLIALVATLSIPITRASTQLHLGPYLVADGEIFEHMDARIEAKVIRPNVDRQRAIVPEWPWESSMHFYGSVISLATETRMYYACNVGGAPPNATRSKTRVDERSAGTDGSSAVCVATSTDNGTTWTKPSLTEVPYENYTHTNMVFTSASGWIDSVLKLPDGIPMMPGLPEGTQFVLAFDDATTDATFRGLQLAVSTDGYHFEKITPQPVLPESFADTSVSVVYDPVAMDFVAFGRFDGYPDQHPGLKCGNMTPDYNMKSVRAVRKATSHMGIMNFSSSNITTPFAFDVLDPQCLDIYNTAASVVSLGACVWNAQPTERAYVAFPAVFHHFGTAVNDGVLDVRFVFSRDGNTFRYIGGDRRSYIPRGFGSSTDTGSLFNQPDDGVAARWDAGLTYMYKGVVDGGDGYQHLYYFGQQGTHARQDGSDRGLFGIGRATIVRNRFISLGVDVPASTSNAINGSATTATMVTTAVVLPTCTSEHSRLHMYLNADVSVAGSISIAVLSNASGKVEPVDGLRHNETTNIVGNRLAAPLANIGNQSQSIGVTTAKDVGDGPIDLLPFGITPLYFEFVLLAPARVFAWEFKCVTE
eukprot:m.210707 g.210707  ORF g.210707 m.210707 type:complete len:604 (+) comp33090_c0_seq1:194-2005(+)